jgi:hypothetical protein
MTERIFLSLKEASAYLQAKGLIGQTVGVLRSAIAAHRLPAVKDGRSWRTTMDHVEAYEEKLWHAGKRDSSYSGRTRSTARGGRKISATTIGISLTREERKRRASDWAKGKRQSWR